jgi:hypothetical protein
MSRAIAVMLRWFDAPPFPVLYLKLMRRFARLFLFALLAMMLGAQGVFADATLCREENGEVSLEWASGDGCQASPAPQSIHCLKDEAVASRGASGHCMQCVDVPLPSETSAKSLSFPVPFAAALVVFVLPENPSHVDGLDGSFPRAAVAFDGMRTVRLLI